MKKRISILSLLMAFVGCSVKMYAQTYETQYKGSIELHAGLEKDYSHHIYSQGFSTIHGVQLNPYLFVGGGVAFIDYHRKRSREYYFQETMIPFFADVKANLPIRNLSPFIDLRGGYSFLTHKGAYVSPGVGVDYKIDKWSTISLRYAIQYQRTTNDHIDSNKYLHHSLVIGYTF